MTTKRHKITTKRHKMTTKRHNWVQRDIKWIQKCLSFSYLGEMGLMSVPSGQLSHSNPSMVLMEHCLPVSYFYLFIYLLFLSEWHSALLWISGSCSSDILESGSLSRLRASRDAGRLASSAKRTVVRKASDLCSLWALWPQLWGGLQVETRSEGGARVEAVRHHHRTPFGETAAAWQPAQSSACWRK